MYGWSVKIEAGTGVQASSAIFLDEENKCLVITTATNENEEAIPIPAGEIVGLINNADELIKNYFAIEGEFIEGEIPVGTVVEFSGGLPELTVPVGTFYQILL